MRKLLIALLATASVVSPAIAQGRGERGPGVRNEARMQARAERQAERGVDRPAREMSPDARAERRAERQGRPDRVAAPAPVAQPQTREVRAERRDDREDFRQDRQDFRRERRDDRQDVRTGEVTRGEFRRDRADDRQDYRRDRRDDRQDFRQDRRGDRVARPNPRQPEWRQDRRDDRRWDRNWRGDNRYNWQRWRQSNRNDYRLPRYYAPRGYAYGYRRFGIGINLGSIFYGSNYWINDPWQYRLPPAYGPYRWVRYYDDVLLVDLRSGRVVDVIHDFFWR